MILRRITEHVKAQNWFAVAVDFVIVVAGVFVGIQVSNWNEARKDWVDEKMFLQRFHDDIETTNELSRRVRERRISYLESLVEAAKVIFDGDSSSSLTDEQCLAISASRYFNVNAPSLPAYDELVGSGRLDIIENSALRAALVEFQQTRDSLEYYKSFQMLLLHDLPATYPALIQLRAYFDTQLGEMQAAAFCNLDAMRKDQSFLNNFSANVDMFDGFIRDGLAPWSAQLRIVHALVDGDLGLRHEEAAAP